MERLHLWKVYEAIERKEGRKKVEMFPVVTRDS